MDRSAAIALLCSHLETAINEFSISTQDDVEEFIEALMSLGCTKEEIRTNPTYHYLHQFYYY